MDCTRSRDEVMCFLSRNDISYELYEHEAAYTIDDCVRMPFIHEDVTICKNVFLCNRQMTSFYLMLLRPHTLFRTSVVSKALGVSRLSFAPDESLHELLCLNAGSVSPLALLFDREKRITLCYEKAIHNTAKIAFHPCDNTATLLFMQDAFWSRVLPSLGVTPVCIETVE